VNAVKRQHNHDREIWNEEQSVEAVPAIQMLEGLVTVVGSEVMLQAMRAGKPKGYGASGVCEPDRRRAENRWSELNQGAGLRRETRSEMIVRDGGSAQRLATTRTKRGGLRSSLRHLSAGNANLATRQKINLLRDRRCLFLESTLARGVPAPS